ncbi:MAG: FAD/NAD(P)-binding oxidoreductase, partial [Gammaproteobacteria bacterium]|nr:FAD/NAD(P)-binding oxidoreductase [Gammaproteobacteria bacterium]
LGMGPCQGRYCAPVAAELLAERSGQPVDEYSFFAPRPPLKPVRIGDIAGCAEIQSPAESR